MSQGTLFVLDSERNAGIVGEVEQAFTDQIKALTDSGVMNETHAGIKALVLRAARAVDQINFNDAASGRAQLIKALNDVAQQLPQPKTAEVSVIDELHKLFNVDSPEFGEYDTPPEGGQ